MSRTVFVYGTLKRGHGNNALLHDAEFLGEAITDQEYTMYNLGWFPGVRAEGKTAIHGELYRVNDEQFARLDRLEGYPNLYNRVQINIPGRSETPWIYIINNEHVSEDSVIQTGVWK